MTNPPLIEGFHPATTVGSSIKLPVYASEKGTKPLIVLHELPGMTESFITYCRKMANEDFKIYMPLIFKSPNTEMKGLPLARFCVSQVFYDLFKAQDDTNARPFTAWLRELVVKVSNDNPDAKIGAVGMCLTGGFAITAIADPQVTAVASCQPAFPFFTKIKTLGLSEAERTVIENGTKGKTIPCVKGYRYKYDILSRDAHIRAAEDLLGSAFERHPYIPKFGHSTLTGKNPNKDVCQDVLTFLKQRL